MTQAVESSVKPIRRTQASRREGSHRGLVRAAIQVIADQGVDAATFEAIGRQAGYSRSLVTRRFGSRHGLIDAVIAYLNARREAICAEYRVDEMSGLDGLLAYTELFLRDLAEQGEMRAYFILLAATVADASPLRSTFAAAHEHVSQRMAGFIRRGQGEGCIRTDIDVDEAALMVGSYQLGLSMQFLVNPATDMEAIMKTSLEAIRFGFKAT